MTTPAPGIRATPAQGLAAGGVALLALPVGLFGSALLSPILVFVLGVVVELAGVMGWLRGRWWGYLAAALAAGLMLGAAAYLLLGLIQPDGPASGGGLGGPPIR